MEHGSLSLFLGKEKPSFWMQHPSSASFAVLKEKGRNPIGGNLNETVDNYRELPIIKPLL
jgi:hypothetical protein